MVLHGTQTIAAHRVISVCGGFHLMFFSYPVMAQHNDPTGYDVTI